MTSAPGQRCRCHARDFMIRFLRSVPASMIICHSQNIRRNIHAVLDAHQQEAAELGSRLLREERYCLGCSSAFMNRVGVSSSRVWGAGLPGGTSGPAGCARSQSTSDTDDKSFLLQDNQKTSVQSSGRGLTGVQAAGVVLPLSLSVRQASS